MVAIPRTSERTPPTLHPDEHFLSTRFSLNRIPELTDESMTLTQVVAVNYSHHMSATFTDRLTYQLVNLFGLSLVRVFP